MTTLLRWVYLVAAVLVIAVLLDWQRGTSPSWGSGERWAAPAEEPCRQAVRANTSEIDNVEWTQAVTFRKDKDGPVLKVRLTGSGTFDVQPYANRDPVPVRIQLRCDYFPATQQACLVDRTEGECEAAAG